MVWLPRVVVVAGALAVLQTGCATKTTSPTVPAVTLTLATSPAAGNPSKPIAADVRVRNVGNTRVWHSDGCVCEPISLTVLGPDGLAVLLFDPMASLPLCPCWFSPLEPRQSLGGRFTYFTGTLYKADHPTWPSPTYPAPAGTYTVIARFSYAPSVPGDFVPLERRTTFEWVP